MDYLKEYKSFVYSHYLSEGVRMTVGIVLPALVFNHFNLLATGVVVSLGAMSTGITDNPGPIHHRKNGMLTCITINTIIAVLTGFAAPYSILLGVLIVVACFTFSMIGVFGTRANSIGVSALLIMVLNIDRHHHGWDVLANAAFVLAGGTWYMLWSLALYGFRPYKLAQQALGDCIMATASYLRTRASFYEKKVDYQDVYQRMMEQQVAVHEKQNLVRELLFKSRRVVKETTVTGRTLVMIFTDMVDLFERTMSTYNDYEAMHDVFGDEEVLEKFHQQILELSNELDDIGIAVKSGLKSGESGLLATHISSLKSWFDDFRDKKRTAENLDHFIGLRHILNSIEDIAGRIHTLHLYTTYNKDLSKRKPVSANFDQFISHQQIDTHLLKENLNFKSNNFRHSVRISIATLAGFIVSQFFKVGHSYWILLTIILILKPAYSLTKQRNIQRLAGTIIGAIGGFAILYFIEDGQALFAIMLVLMIFTYSLIKTNYLAAVMFMTAYILVLFHLLNHADFKTIFIDRVTDTFIGSAIAYLANLILLPAWEHKKISDYMLIAVRSNKQYFKNVAAAFTGNPVSITTYKLSRKNAFVALANLSDAFTRMLEEPKSKQRNSKILHHFVVLNHTLISHVATLASYVTPLSEKLASADFQQPVDITETSLEDAEKIIEELPADPLITDKNHQNIIQENLEHLLQTRRKELSEGITESDTKKQLSELKPLADQFNFIEKIAADIRKTTVKWMEE